MQKFILTFYLVTFSFLALGQTSYKDIYNLTFDKSISNPTNKDNWQISSSGSHLFENDTINKVGGISSLHCSAGDSPNNNQCKIYQYIPLLNPNENFKISWWAKSSISKSSLTKVVVLDLNGKVVLEESVSYNTSKDWKKNTLIYNCKTGQVLYLEFSVNNNSHLWIDELTIELNNKNIYDYSSTDNVDKSEISKKSTKTTLNKGIKTSSKTIIGIGESVHGCHEIAVSRNEIIKYLVEKKNCRLVIFETNYDYVARLNNFISGKIGEQDIFRIEDASRSQFYMFNDEMLDILRWLKLYNTKASKKVVIAGMDINISSRDSLCYIFAKYKIPAFEKLNSQLDNLKSVNFVTKLIENSIEIENALGKDEFQNLLWHARLFEQYKIFRYGSGDVNAIRDSCMAENVKEFTRKFTSKNEISVVCAHLAHLSKSNFNFLFKNETLGQLLVKEYKNRYLLIAQMVGEGNCMVFQHNPSTLNLYSPIHKSAEQYLMEYQDTSFLIDIANLPKNNDVLFGRFIGGMRDMKQFYSICNFQNSCDLIQFERFGSPLHFFNEKYQLYVDNNLKNNQISQPIKINYKISEDIYNRKSKSTRNLKDGIYLFIKQGIEYQSRMNPSLVVKLDSIPFVSFDQIQSINFDGSGDDCKLSIQLDSIGSEKLKKHTENNYYCELPLVVNNFIVSIPKSRGGISNGFFTISGLTLEKINLIKNSFEKISKNKK